MTIKRRVYQVWYAFFFLLTLNQKFSLPYIGYSMEIKKWFIGVSPRIDYFWNNGMHIA